MTNGHIGKFTRSQVPPAGTINGTQSGTQSGTQNCTINGTQSSTLNGTINGTRSSTLNGSLKGSSTPIFGSLHGLRCQDWLPAIMIESPLIIKPILYTAKDWFGKK